MKISDHLIIMSSTDTRFTDQQLYVSWKESLNKIHDYLFLGSVKARHESIIRENDIRRVIRIVTKAQEERKPIPLPQGIKETVFYLSDEPSSNIIPLIEYAIPIINKAIVEKENLLVHCEAGISRSASIIIGYLIREKNMSPKDALDYVEERRPCIWPNHGFWNQLENFK